MSKAGYTRIHLMDAGYYLLAVPVLAIAISYVTGLSSIPYNIRELMGDESRYVSSVMLALSIFVALGPPAWIGIALVRVPPDRLAAVATAFFVHLLVTCLGVRLSVPPESMHDIVGYPVLGWPWGMEVLGRFSALFAVVAYALAGGAAIVYLIIRSPTMAVIHRWLWGAAAILPLGYWIVIKNASTDNLVELIAGQGDILAVLSIFIWLIILGINTSLLAVRIAGCIKNTVAVTLGVCILGTIGYLLVLIGSESQVYKYGESYSALAFLLSPDRSQYVHGVDLVIRYVAAYAGIMGLLVLSQIPAWRHIFRHQHSGHVVGHENEHPETAGVRQADNAGMGGQRGGAESLELAARRSIVWKLFFLFYVLFVIYGSLVPFDFVSTDYADVLSAFSGMQFVPPESGYAASDFAVNILLYIPLTFLAAQMLPATRGVRTGLLLALILIGACIMSASLELLQVSLPSRSASSRDILTNAMGSAGGILLWWYAGTGVARWLDGWRFVRGTASTAEYLLWIYIAIVAVYNVFPLDLSISPAEIYRKWSDGGIVLIPFSYIYEDVFQLLYAMIADTAIWIPISMLWLLGVSNNAFKAWGVTIIIAVAIELAQIIVISRIFDVTDILLSMLGALLGVVLARLIYPDNTVVKRAEASQGLPVAYIYIMISWVLWTAILLAVFWYPYDFILRPDFIGERMKLLHRPPFSDYFYSSELRALTAIIRQVIFFAPFGILMYIARISAISPGQVFFVLITGSCAIAATPFVIELGQVALAAKMPSLVDWLVSVLSAAGAYAAARSIHVRMLPDNKKYA